MIVRRELLFDNLLLREKKVDEAQLKEARKIQRSENHYRSLGRILVDMGLLEVDDVAELIRMQWDEMAHAAATSVPRETLFGAIAIMKQYVTLSQVEESLREQKRLRRLGLFMRLGEIMVSKGYMTVKQVMDVLRSQRTQVMECPGCGKTYNVTLFAGAKKPRCPLCGHILKKPRRLRSPHVDGRA